MAYNCALTWQVKRRLTWTDHEYQDVVLWSEETVVEWSVETYNTTNRHTMITFISPIWKKHITQWKDKELNYYFIIRYTIITTLTDHYTVLITTVTNISESVSEAALTAARRGKTHAFFYSVYVRSLRSLMQSSHLHQVRIANIPDAASVSSTSTHRRNFLHYRAEKNSFKKMNMHNAYVIASNKMFRYGTHFRRITVLSTANCKPYLPLFPSCR